MSVNKMVARSSLAVSALLFCFFQSGCCQDGPTQITISPASLVLTPNVSDTAGGQVTVTCRASSVGAGEDLVGMVIERVLHANPNAAPVYLAGASPSNNNGNAELTPQSLQATVSGSISLKSITLTLTRANCGDAGMYICRATALTAGFQTRLYSNSANMTIEVSPGDIELVAEPSGVNTWRVNDTLILRCNAVVGTVFNENQIEWMWEFRNANASFTGSENWQSYATLGDPDSDITTDPLVATNTCYKRQISALTRRLTLDDAGRQYRCYVINRDVISNSAVYAKVYSVTALATTTTTISETTTAAASPVRHDVVCGPTSISFSIPVPALVADETASQTVTLSDPRCRVDTGNRILRGSTGLNSCGTTLEVTNDSLIYSNVILLPQANNSDASNVIPIQCSYDRLANITVAAYLPIVRQVLFTETGVGKLNFRINQYRDASFSNPVADSAFPLRLRPSDDVFVELSLGGEQQLEGLGMDVISCIALPSSSPAAADVSGVHEDLVENNCPASSDVRLLNDNNSMASLNHSLFRFGFKAVTFPDPSDPQRSSTGVVYIHCRVRLCESSECRSGGQCPSSSASSRSKRSVGRLAEGSAGHQLSTGPLLVEGDSAESNASSPLVIFLGVVAACATLVAMVATVAWRRSRRRSDFQRLDKVTADVQ